MEAEFLELIAAAESINQDDENFLQFYEYMVYVKRFIVTQQSQQQGGHFTSDLLLKMENSINRACEIIEGYKSKRLHKRSVLSKLNRCAEEIYNVLRQSVPLVQTNAVHYSSIAQISYMPILLEAKTPSQDMSGSGSSSSASSCPSPIETPEIQVGETNKETPEIELRLQCTDEPLCDNCFFKLMGDPVYVPCHHTFDRKAIEEYLQLGHRFCPVCKSELSSVLGKLELKPNPSIISEWKAKKLLSDFAAGINQNDIEYTNRVLDSLEALMMRIPNCISGALEPKLIPELTGLLRNSAVNSGAVLRCLLPIARFSDENKETIGRGGVIKCLLQHSRQEETTAVEILLELSTNKKVAQKIIESKTFTATLMSLLSTPSTYLAEMAHGMLMNLSTTNVSSTIKMAKAGHFPLFLQQFNSAGEEKRAFMAEELAKMELEEATVSCLENELFIDNLTVMLTGNSPESKLASLKCVKWLMAFTGLRSWILSMTGYTIPATLLCMVTDTSAERRCKQEAMEILIFLIETSSYLEKLCSSNSIQDLIEQFYTSSHEDRVLLLRLILAMVNKSDAARKWAISNQKAMGYLFSALSPDENGEVRLTALKLIHSITAGDDAPFPANETAVRSIVSVLTKSGVIEEISMAASIIGRLPHGDKCINKLVQSAAVLKSLISQITGSSNSNEQIENAIGALLRCVDQSNSQFQLELANKLEQPIVRLLSNGSPLTKQRAAMILTHLSHRRTPEPGGSLLFRWHTLSTSQCDVHKSSCSLHHIICLVKAGALRPLLAMVGTVNSAATEAALMALYTLFDKQTLDSGVSKTLFNDAAASAIVENEGVEPILEVLRKGPAPVKKVALELFEKIWRHPGITREESGKFKAILFRLLNEEPELREKAKALIQELT